MQNMTKIKNRKKLAVSRGYILVIFLGLSTSTSSRSQKVQKNPENYLNSLSLAVIKTDRNDKKLAEREACVINIAAAAHYSIKQATRAFQQL